MPDADPAQPRPARAVDASMTLLNEVMHRPLDPGYAAAAGRRARGEEAPRAAVTIVVLLVVAIVLGFGTARAAIELRKPQPGVVAARTLLQDEITSTRAEVATLTAQNAALGTSIDTLRDSALEFVDPELVRTVALDGFTNGTVAAKGPGITVTVADGADAATDPAAFVQDSDLQSVVNALWSAGAEAIAINGQRLTATTSIRSAGSAILVDLVGVAGPYEVVAIGNRNDLETGLARSSAAQQLSALGSQYGIKTSVATHEDLLVPAGPTRVLFSAQPLGTDNGDK
ncbi:DUF881 domain-containing protein [Sanguibacter gelidistatuariae]|nr:DUF881 domain-containing protein [Sanguibacter gelidistatuariae]